jgi:hypothetical protein
LGEIWKQKFCIVSSLPCRLEEVCVNRLTKESIAIRSPSSFLTLELWQRASWLVLWLWKQQPLPLRELSFQLRPEDNQSSWRRKLTNITVRTFLAAPRLEAVVVFLGAAVFLPARTFLAGAALALDVVALAAGVFVTVDFFAAAAAVLVVPPDDLVAAAEVAVVLGLDAGFLAVVALALAVLAVFGLAATLGLAVGLFCLLDQDIFKEVELGIFIPLWSQKCRA